MATQDPKTDPQVEEKEEKDSPSILSNLVQMIILFWSLSVISFAYFGNSTKQIDTTFAAGLLSAVMSNMGLQVKNNANGKKRPFNVVSNKDNNVGISKK
jgi:hypothetical protein